MQRLRNNIPNLAATGFVLGICFWIFESALHTIFWDGGSFLGQLATSEANEVWIRLVVMALLTSFGFVAQTLINQRRAAESALRKNKEQLQHALEGTTDALKVEKKALYESEDKFRLISEQSFLGFAIVQDHKIVYVNQAVADMNGYSVDEMLTWNSEDFARIIHPDDLSFVVEQEQKKQVGDSDVLKHYSYRSFTKDGRLKWLDQYSRTIQLNGRPADLITFVDITERKAAEEKLKDSEERYHSIFRYSTDAIMILSEDRFQDCNNETLKLFGLKNKSEFVSLHPAVLSPPTQPDGMDSLTAANKHIAAAYKNGRSKFEWVHRRKDGEDFLAEVSLTAFPSKDGQLIQAIVRDITDRKRAEDALLESESKFRAIIENSQPIIFMVDREGIFVLSEGRSLAALGLKSGEAVGRSAFDMYAEYPGIIGGMQKSMNGERSSTTVDLDGIYFDIVLAPYYDSEGNILGTMGIALDINERKLAEDALLQSEEKYRTIFENSNIGIALIDLDGRTQQSNPSLQKMSGYSNDELAQLSMPDYLHADEIEEAIALFNELIDGKRESYNLERRFISKSGELRWGHLNVSLVHRASGEPHFAISMLEDITDRKNNEQRLKALSSQLVMAQEAERRHIAIELHDDIGQDLSFLAVKLEDLRVNSKQDSTQEDLALALATVDMTLTKIRNLSLNLRPSMLDELGLQATLKWYLARQGKLTGIDLKFRARGLDQRLPTEIETTGFRITQEAVTNAVKHANASNVVVDISQTADEINLVIRDNGRGFDVDEAFQNAASGKSVGLLSMQERSALVGGTVEINSSIESGTAIHCSLPVNTTKAI